MLRNGAERVVAVEIDPGIIEIGKRFHLERPYHDPRCVVVNDDARSYFATSTEKFDLIAFGLLDSHTTTAMTNARLDHYVYTQESINQVRALLKPGGVAVLSFEATKPYIADRMAIVLKQAFGHDPVMFRVPCNAYGWGGLLFVVGDSREAVDTRIAADPKLAGLVKEWQEANPVTLPGTTKAPTDDWPYIYLEKPTIPFLYFVLAAVLALLYLFGRRQLGGAGADREVGPRRLALLLPGGGVHAPGGAEHQQGRGRARQHLGRQRRHHLRRDGDDPPGQPHRRQVPETAAAAGLCAARPLVHRALLPRPVAVRVPALCDEGAGGRACSRACPCSSAASSSSGRSRRRQRKDAALGANLLGALVGGLLQTITFVVGIKALLLIVAALYVSAVLSRPKAVTAAGGDVELRAAGFIPAVLV